MISHGTNVVVKCGSGGKTCMRERTLAELGAYIRGRSIRWMTTEDRSVVYTGADELNSFRQIRRNATVTDGLALFFTNIDQLHQPIDKAFDADSIVRQKFILVIFTMH